MVSNLRLSSKSCICIFLSFLLFPISSWLLPLICLGWDVDEKTLGSMEKTGKDSPGPRGWAEFICSLILSPRITVPFQAPCWTSRMQSWAGHSLPGTRRMVGYRQQAANRWCEGGHHGKSTGLGWAGTQPSLGWCRRATEHNLWADKRQLERESRGISVQECP